MHHILIDHILFDHFLIDHSGDTKLLRQFLESPRRRSEDALSCALGFQEITVPQSGSAVFGVSEAQRAISSGSQ